MEDIWDRKTNFALNIIFSLYDLTREGSIQVRAKEFVTIVAVNPISSSYMVFKVAAGEFVNFLLFKIKRKL